MRHKSILSAVPLGIDHDLLGDGAVTLANEVEVSASAVDGSLGAGTANTNTASGQRRRRKDAEPSGVAMPGIRGIPVVERVLRPRNTRNREDMMDGLVDSCTFTGICSPCLV